MAEHEESVAWRTVCRIVADWNSEPYPGWLPDGEFKELREALTTLCQDGWRRTTPGAAEQQLAELTAILGDDPAGRAKALIEKEALMTPRPLALRNGVADIMIDELAKQYQKVAVYSSKAKRWRARAVELGSHGDYVFEADAGDALHDEEALKLARNVLANAWEQQDEEDADCEGDNPVDASRGGGSGVDRPENEASESQTVIESLRAALAEKDAELANDPRHDGT